MAVVENVYKDKESCWISEDAIEASYYVICSRKCMAHYAFKQCILSSSDDDNDSFVVGLISHQYLVYLQSIGTFIACLWITLV